MESLNARSVPLHVFAMLILPVRTSHSEAQKLGPDHIAHKHVAGVKYEDAKVKPKNTQNINPINWPSSVTGAKGR
jgi:hypothetical protein